MSVIDPATESASFLLEEPELSDGTPVNIFCSGHSQLADGKIAFFGGGFEYVGKDSHDHVVIYDPVATSNYWLVQDDMPPEGILEENDDSPAGKRYYPTALTLGNGKVLVLSGGTSNSPTDADAPILFDPSKPTGTGQQWTQPVDPCLCSGAQPQCCDNDSDSIDALLFPWYPMAFQLNDGTVYVAGSNWYPAYDECSSSCSTCDPYCEWKAHVRGRFHPGLGTWSDVVSDLDPPGGAVEIKGGAGVMYRPGLFMVAGGGIGDGAGNSCTQVEASDLATNRVRKCDALNVSPT